MHIIGALPQEAPLPEAPDTPAPVHRVAVVAVHGVGKTEPGSTAHHIADLLLGIGRLKLTCCSDPGKPAPPPDPWNAKETGPRYSATDAADVQIPLRPAPVTSGLDARARVVAEEASLISRVFHYWAEHRGYLAEVFSGRRSPQVIQRDISDRHFLAHEFMRSQLAGYVAQEDGTAFTTTRLGTERREGTEKRPVHIFDMRWSDLARPESSIVSFFAAFYQLLFHLGSLSRTAVDHAVVEHTADPKQARPWRWLSFFQSLAVRILVIPIPVLNMLMLVAASTVVPLALGPQRRMAAAAFAGVAILTGWLFLVARLPVPSKRRLWLLLVWGLPLVVAAGAFVGFRAAGAEITDLALAIEWWLLGAALLAFVLDAYESVRRGAYWSGIALLVLSFAGFLYCWCRAGGDHRLEQASLWTLELIVGACILCWLALLVTALVGHLLGTVCRWWPYADEPTKARAWAAVRTGRLTLALATATFLLTTIFLWTGAFAGTNRRLHLYATIQVTPPPIPQWLNLDRAFTVLVPTFEDVVRWAHPPTCPTPCPAVHPSHDVRLAQLEYKLMGAGYNGNLIPVEKRIADLETRLHYPARSATFSAPLDEESRIALLDIRSGAAGKSEFEIFAGGLLLIGVTSGFPLMLALLAAAFVLPLAAVVPTLLARSKSLHCYASASMRSLGDWYSRGLDSFRTVTSVGWHAIFTVAFLFGFLDLIYCHGWQDTALGWSGQMGWLNTEMSRLTACTIHILDGAAAVLVTSGTAITALIYRYGLAPLDILLDVDTYLRTSPLENAPRARIAERYVSLLRYICNRKDEDGEYYYHSVVIAAHSLGALISADLLSYLKRERDPELERLGFGDKANGAMPLRLLSFGNPLRQLLNRFFPHLYWWVREAPDGATTGALPASPVRPDNLDAATTPNATDLGLELWANAYRSGDFVGRSLWLDTWMQRTANEHAAPRPDVIRDSVDQRREACIGYGAHNDYWNRSAPDIANLLDDLISA